MVHALDEVFTIIQTRLRSAQQRFNGAQDDHMTRYYKGQVDTLRVILRDIEATKFERGIELHDDISHTPQAQDVPDAHDQSPTVSHSASRSPEGHTSKTSRTPRTPKTRKAGDIHESPYKALAQQAITQGIMTQKSSHFFHDLLPEKHVQGYPRLYQAFEDDERFRQAIQAALQEATTPPSVDHHVKAEDAV